MPATPEADVVVVGAGRAGLAAARAAQGGGARVLVVEKRADAPGEEGLDARGDAMALDVILTESGEAAGVVLASQASWSVAPARAKAVVLATGGIGALWPGGDAWATGDGLVVAHRAGARVAHVAARFASDGRATLAGGVLADRFGATSVPGLYVADPLAASGVRAEDVGRAAAKRALALGEFPPFGPYTMMPTIDSPLPRGFASVKLERLQATMAQHFGTEGPRDVEQGLILLHRLKGEADEFARARVDVELLSFKFACEAALLIARATEARIERAR